MEIITSRHNPLVAHLRRLASSGSYRRERGEFLCDSPKLLHEALLHGAELLTVAATRGMALPDGIHAGVRLVEVPEDVMQLISPAKTPQGVVFTCRLPRTECPQTLTGARYLALDGVQDPGNVGTILRTLDAFEADGLVLLPGCADPFSPKTVRSSMGAVFRMAVPQITEEAVFRRPVWTCTAETFAQVLRGSGLRLLGAALRDDTVDARAADYTRAVLAIGSEGRGLSEEVLALCDETVRIPMSPRCESLNAAVAASVLLWEAYR